MKAPGGLDLALGSWEGKLPWVSFSWEGIWGEKKNMAAKGLLRL